jgi:hypothetical protein
MLSLGCGTWTQMVSKTIAVFTQPVSTVTTILKIRLLRHLRKKNDS